MPRRSSRKFKLKLKPQTIYTIAAVMLFGVALIITLSFFQEGTILAMVKDEIVNLFGWSGLLLPLILTAFGIFALGLKNRLAHPTVSVGLCIIFGSLIGLTQAGILGFSLWSYLDELISGPGAAVILAGVLIIGLTVLFNTSIDRVFGLIFSGFTATGEFIKKYIFGTLSNPHKEAAFREIRAPMQVKGNGGELVDMKKISKMDIAIKSAPAQPKGKDDDIRTPKMVQYGAWQYPPMSIFSETPAAKADRGDIKKNASIIEKTLESFGISARVNEVNLGPSVTQYALEIALGTKISKITSLASDLALALAAHTGTIRIEAPIPGRSLVGIEIPNRSPELVTMRQVLQSQQMRQGKAKLTVGLGLDVSGMPVVADIHKMPHVLVAGTTGSGKSVFINSRIATLLFRLTPDEVKFILVDPKRVELTLYNGIPHLLTPVIVDVDKTLSALKWAIKEMDRRYKLFAELGVRNIESYHEQSGVDKLPYILIFIDELADLMSYAPVEVEDNVTRLAQMARATGMHLILSTQRPSVDVITGLLKANIPSRIAFNVSSMIDSKVILDMPGAEKLLGKGDMLYIPPDQAKPARIQGTFISEKEVTRLVDFLKKQSPMHIE